MDKEKKYTDIMIDIETLDTRPTAIIMTMAAVCFTPGYSIDKGPEFYEKVYIPEQELLRGRTRCPETEKWWNDQTHSAINESFSGQVALECALFNLASFIKCNSDPENVRIWAKSPQFDLVIIKNAFEQFRISVPWSFRNERDVRTYIMGSMKAKILGNDNPHHALHDAHRQIEQLWWAHRDMNK